jgi:DNA mismatch repair protein MutL
MVSWEALPAIASVSRLRVDTCDGSGERGHAHRHQWRILKRLVARARGTTMEVGLFFNTPARRKFMRAPPTEAGHVSEAVLRLGLAHTECGFVLRSGGRAVLTWPGGTPLAARAAAALGREAASALVPVEATRGEVRVFGVVGPPEHAQPTGRGLYLFVNGRFVRDRAAANAALRAYSGSLTAGRYPVGVLSSSLSSAST